MGRASYMARAASSLRARRRRIESPRVDSAMSSSVAEAMIGESASARAEFGVSLSSA